MNNLERFIGVISDLTSETIILILYCISIVFLSLSIIPYMPYTHYLLTLQPNDFASSFYASLYAGLISALVGSGIVSYVIYLAGKHDQERRQIDEAMTELSLFKNAINLYHLVRPIPIADFYNPFRGLGELNKHIAECPTYKWSKIIPKEPLVSATLDFQKTYREFLEIIEELTRYIDNSLAPINPVFSRFMGNLVNYVLRRSTGHMYDSDSHTLTKQLGSDSLSDEQLAAIYTNIVSSIEFQKLVKQYDFCLKQLTISLNLLATATIP